jgi:hypothetical protein
VIHLTQLGATVGGFTLAICNFVKECILSEVGESVIMNLSVVKKKIAGG